MKVSLLGFIADFRYRKISQRATVEDFLKEIFRKTIHISSSFVPAFALRNYYGTLIALSFIVCFYTFSEYWRLSGRSIPVISVITAYAARRRDEGGFVLGPVTMGVGIVLTLLLFPPETARIGIFALAFGDGIASLAGKLYGKIKIPFTDGKTLAGSSACFIAVYLSTLTVTRDLLKSLAIALVAVFLEVIPVKDYDNLFIPVLVSGFVCLLP
jgi:phytol kinase